MTSFLASPDGPAWLGVPSGDDEATGGETRRMLDYACGDGVLTCCLRAHYPRAVGVDVSERMLDRYRAAAASLGLGPEAMAAVRADLAGTDDDDEDASSDGPALRGFDLVAVGMALHHFSDPAAALRRLAARLRPGGTLLVVDWAPLDGSTPAQRRYEEELQALGVRQEDVRAALGVEAEKRAVSRPDGFAEREMRDLFERAGCGEVRWRLAEELCDMPVVEHLRAQLFWARATKT